MKHWRPRLGEAAVALLLGSVLVVGWLAHTQRRQLDLGRALFDGTALQPEQRLIGTMAGHDRALPAAAARCVNCHTGSTTGAPGFAPPLHAGTLSRALARRGGPPSAYDSAALCRVLREGIDPAWVLISQAMPRYEATDAQCAALWAWLVRSSEQPAPEPINSSKPPEGSANDGPT